MRVWIIRVALVTLFFGIMASEGLARRTHFTPEQRDHLQAIHTVWVKVLALTERGKGDGQAIQDIVQERLTALGYQVVTSRDDPSDAMLMVKCEEQKKWAGTTRAGGDADHLDAPARLWKGPACLFTYMLDGRDLGWKKEARTDFTDAVSAAKAANAPQSGSYAMAQLAQRLQHFDFPVMLAAEWGQIDRLLQLLEAPNTPKLRKVKILSALSELHAEEALPKLTQLLESTDLQQETINALAGAGIDSIPLLIDFFQTSTQSPIRAEAAKTLGTIAAKTGDPRTIPPLVQYVSRILPQIKTSDDIDFPLLTEVVWAIGKSRWEGSFKPIGELQKKVWLIFDNSKKMADLREATSWTYKQLDLDGHIS
jgi:hypothetical protein